MYWDIKEGNKLINNCIQITMDINYVYLEFLAEQDCELNDFEY